MGQVASSRPAGEGSNMAVDPRALAEVLHQSACGAGRIAEIAPRGVLLKDRLLLLKSFAEGLSLELGGLGGLGADDGAA